MLEAAKQCASILDEKDKLVVEKNNIIARLDEQLRRDKAADAAIIRSLQFQLGNLTVPAASLMNKPNKLDEPGKPNEPNKPNELVKSNEPGKSDEREEEELSDLDFD